LNKFFVGKPIYDAILADLNHAISDTVWMSPDAFMPHLTEVLSKATTDKKLLEKIADGLSVMDKNAEIQRDRKGNVVYDKETKDTELVKWEESIEDYMAREVLPHIPDAAAFFEENLGAKKPVIKTGAEIPFTRYFYKYQQPIASEELEAKFSELELSVSERVAQLFE
jgi:type I restriction enzyme M protein